MPARRHIGLEIGDTEFRMVELRADGDGPVLSYAGVQQTEFNYGSTLLHEAPYNRNIAKAFIRDLTALFHERGLQAPRVSVALPASSVLLATIPLDKDLTPAEKKEQLSWECRTLYGYDSDTEIDVRSFILDTSADAETTLVAAIPKQTNEFLRSVFGQLTYTVSDLDVDHFVMENAMAARIPKLNDVNYAVIGLYEEYCSAGIYTRGTYRGFKQGKVSFHEGYFAQTLRLLQGVLETAPGTQLEAVFVYGSATTRPLLDSLRTLLKIPITKFDPINGMPFLTQEAATAVSSFAPHVFDVAISAAILGMK